MIVLVKTDYWRLHIILENMKLLRTCFVLQQQLVKISLFVLESEWACICVHYHHQKLTASLYHKRIHHHHHHHIRRRWLLPYRDCWYLRCCRFCVHYYRRIFVLSAPMPVYNELAADKHETVTANYYVTLNLPLHLLL